MKQTLAQRRDNLFQRLKNPGFLNLSDPEMAAAFPDLNHDSLTTPLKDFFTKNQIHNEGKDIPVGFGSFLLSSNLNNRIAKDLSTLLGAVEKIPSIWLNSSSLRKQYNLSDKYLVPLLAEKTRSRWIDYSRFDFIINPDQHLFPCTLARKYPSKDKTRPNSTSHASWNAWSRCVKTEPHQIRSNWQSENGNGGR